jgi:hypothetical protein
MLAIADAVSPAWGAKAREAAVWFAGEQQEEDVGVRLLADIRDFDAGVGVDVMFSSALADALVDIDDAPWEAWCGVHDNHAPRRLGQAELAKLLKPFGIRPRSIFPPGGRQARGSSRKGYRRSQFIGAWAAYCPAAGTPAHGGKIKYLRGS